MRTRRSRTSNPLSPSSKRSCKKLEDGDLAARAVARSCTSAACSSRGSATRTARRRGAAHRAFSTSAGRQDAPPRSTSDGEPARSDATHSTCSHVARRSRRAVDEALERVLPTPPRAPRRAADAMRYSLLGGGKRLRPMPDAGGRRGRRERRGGRRDARDARPAGRVRRRADPHLLARPRRSARHGRRHAAAGSSDDSRRLRRGPGDSRRRRPAHRSVRAARREPRRPRWTRHRLAAAQAARDRASSPTPRARPAWSAVRRSICSPAGSVAVGALDAARCTTCTRARPAR